MSNLIGILVKAFIVILLSCLSIFVSIFCILYILFPCDLIPDFVPVLGFADDLLAFVALMANIIVSLLSCR